MDAARQGHAKMAMATIKNRIIQARADPQTDPVEQLQKLADREGTP